MGKSIAEIFRAGDLVDRLVVEARRLVADHGSPDYARTIIAERLADDMSLHRHHFAQLIAVAVVDTAEQEQAAAAPVSPAGPYCQGCGQPYHPLRQGEPAHVCHEHRSGGRG